MWERTSIEKRYFPITKSYNVFIHKALRKYRCAWARGSAEIIEVDEPHLKSSAPGVRKNGFCGF
jgi:hypothetical protein